MFKQMTFFKSLTLGILLVYHFIFTQILVTALANGGIIAININKFGEGFIEVIVAIFIAIAGVWFFWELHRQRGNKNG